MLYRQLKEEDWLRRKRAAQEAQLQPAFYEMDSNVKIRGLARDKDSMDRKQKKSSKFVLYF
jgi:hypothetical protein